MGRWTLAALPKRFDAGEFTPREHLVVSYLQVPTSVPELVQLTGLESSQIEDCLQRLLAYQVVTLDALPEGVEPWQGEAMPVGRASTAPEGEASESQDEASAEPQGEASAPESEQREFRKVFERRFAILSLEARMSAAASARGADISALCFDSEPRIVAQLLENSEFGPVHARLVARHHRNARGLEILARHRKLLSDPEVHRCLLQNPQAPVEVLTRLLGYKPLREVYKSSVDRDLPERNRTLIRGELRKKYSQADPEERAELVLRTEGRALLLLTGCTFDGRMTQILCGKTIVSTLLIGNLARFSATPPALLAKLLQNPCVKRQPQLRTLLLKHPNFQSSPQRS